MWGIHPDPGLQPKGVPLLQPPPSGQQLPQPLLPLPCVSHLPICLPHSPRDCTEDQRPPYRETPTGGWERRGKDHIGRGKGGDGTRPAVPHSRRLVLWVGTKPVVIYSSKGKGWTAAPALSGLCLSTRQQHALAVQTDSVPGLLKRLDHLIATRNISLDRSIGRVSRCQTARAGKAMVGVGKECFPPPFPHPRHQGLQWNGGPGLLLRLDLARSSGYLRSV